MSKLISINPLGSRGDIRSKTWMLVLTWGLYSGLISISDNFGFLF